MSRVDRYKHIHENSKPQSEKKQGKNLIRADKPLITSKPTISKPIQFHPQANNPQEVT